MKPEALTHTPHPVTLTISKNMDDGSTDDESDVLKH